MIPLSVIGYDIPPPPYDDVSLYLFLILIVLPFLFYAYRSKNKFSTSNILVNRGTQPFVDNDVLGQVKTRIAEIKEGEKAILFKPLPKGQWMKTVLYLFVFYILILVFVGLTSL
ncbi:MAG: hypothetical protein AAGA77_11090 [Bacteroidota bacterium]